MTRCLRHRSLRADRISVGKPTGALADCAEELAHLTEDDTGQSEEMDGGTFATMGQKAPAQTQSSDTGSAQAGSGGDAGSSDRAAALQRAQAALDAGDEAACIEAVEEAKTM